MQPQIFELFEQHAAVAVHDAFRPAGGAGGVQHPQGVVEGDRGEDRFGRVRDHLSPEGVAPAGGGRPAVTDPQHLAQTGDLVTERVDGVAVVVDRSGVPGAVGGNQDDGIELCEPVGGPGGAVFRTACTPDGSEAGAGEERDDRFGDVREVSDDPVSRCDPAGGKPVGDRANLSAELVPRQCGLPAALIEPDYGRTVAVDVVMLESMSREIQSRAGKPLGAGHFGVLEGLPRGPGGVDTDIEKVPDGGPEVLEPFGGPVPQCRIVLEGQSPRSPNQR